MLGKKNWYSATLMTLILWIGYWLGIFSQLLWGVDIFPNEVKSGLDIGDAFTYLCSVVLVYVVTSDDRFFGAKAAIRWFLLGLIFCLLSILESDYIFPGVKTGISESMLVGISFWLSCWLTFWLRPIKALDPMNSIKK